MENKNAFFWIEARTVEAAVGTAMDPRRRFDDGGAVVRLSNRLLGDVESSKLPTGTYYCSLLYTRARSVTFPPISLS